MATRWLTLPLDQRQVVDRIEDHVLAIMAAGMACDHLAAGTDYDRVDIAPDPDVTVAVGDGHRVIVGLVAHQRLGANPSGGLIAGIKRRRLELGHSGQIPREALADRLGLAP